MDHFVKKFNKKLNKNILGISTDVQKMFMDYNWPGNIREMEHALEHAFILCHLKTITIEHLPPTFENFFATNIAFYKNKGVDEKQAILQALEKTAWNKTMAAKLLGISRRNIYRKIKEHNIEINKKVNCVELKIF